MTNVSKMLRITDIDAAYDYGRNSDYGRGSAEIRMVLQGPLGAVQFLVLKPILGILHREKKYKSW
jgi:hypothetical protein